MPPEEPVRRNRTCPGLSHSRAKEGWNLSTKSYCVIIMQSHSWRQSLPGSSNLPGPLELRVVGEGGKKHWCEWGTVSTRGIWVER